MPSFVGDTLMPFVKAHACGNDFLILEERDARRRHAELARRHCRRSTGVGADGIEFLDRRANGERFLRLFNADGSEAELSGNGTRCVAAWLAHSEGLAEVTLGTHGGPRGCRVIEQDGAVYRIESGMGMPRVMPRTLALEGVGDVAGAMVNVGNPHFVLFSEEEDFSAYGMTWEELGARISGDARFPHGTNVEFVRVQAPDVIAFRIFERGCGPTMSSGTGTCASSAAAIVLRGAAPELTAIAEGGAQTVRWTGKDAEMMLTGPAEILCEGRLVNEARGAEMAVPAAESWDA